MKIEMEFQGLQELVKAFEDAASDEDIRAVNKKIVEHHTQRTAFHWGRSRGKTPERQRMSDGKSRIIVNTFM